MIKITNGIVTLDVTPGAYKGIYALQGFHEIADEMPSEAKNKPDIEPDAQGSNLPWVTPEDVTEGNSEPSEDKFETAIPEQAEDLSEIPLGEMNSEQLKAYARQLGVDLRGLNSKRAVRDKIRAAL